MVHLVRNLSPDQRTAIEDLLGRTLLDEESLTIRPARILQDAPSGEERTTSFHRYQDSLDRLADRVKDVGEEEIDATIADALRAVRHRAE
jgi:hypothetical protein